MTVLGDNDASSYLVSDFEGLSTIFSEITELPSSGYCRLFKAKRYGRWYLLKCLKSEHAADVAFQQMLRKEFEILMRLQHPSVMQAIGMETVKLPDGSKAVCLVAEWIDGVTLDSYLADNPSQRDRLRIALELVDALTYIHQQQIVHRDLKPSNIMITHNGSYVKLIDFGLADTDSHAILKQPAGTLKYMAPEQMQQAVPDVRNDIYSLGIILQEMNLRGRIYNKVIERCLKPIHQRYQNMDELLVDIRQRRNRHWKIWALAAVSAIIITLLLIQVHEIRKKTLDIEKHAAELNLQMKVLNHEIIGFEDPEVKQKCIRHWDVDHDGELSYAEAAAVKELGTVFSQDSLITSFDELEHFTGLGAIGQGAFWACSRLSSVKLPRTIRYIRQNAFRGTALEIMTIPSSVVAIGDHILEDCPKLETLMFESVLPNTNEGSHHLVNCPRLSTIFVPEYHLTQETEKTSWREWTHLMTTHVKFHDPLVKAICVSYWDRNGDHELSIDEAMTVTSLGAAFAGNQKIKTFEELRFFTGLTEIEASAFDRCFDLQRVLLPNTIKTIGENAFLGCDLLSVYIPAGTTSIAPTAFGANRHLVEVVVSDENPVYDSRGHCNAIIETDTNQMLSGSVTAVIPRSVTSLSDVCFSWYEREELILPSQITHIGYWSLTSVIGRVYCESPVPPTFDSQGGHNFLFPTAEQGKPEPEIYVPYGSLQAYCQAEGWSFFAHRIREYPASVPSYSFSMPTWTNLDQVTFFDFH